MGPVGMHPDGRGPRAAERPGASVNGRVKGIRRIHEILVRSDVEAAQANDFDHRLQILNSQKVRECYARGKLCAAYTVCRGVARVKWIDDRGQVYWYCRRCSRQNERLFPTWRKA